MRCFALEGRASCRTTARVYDRGMAVFVSRRERRLWLWTLIAVATIYFTLGLTRRVAWALRDNDLLTITFVAGMVLVAATVAAHAVRRRAGQAEIIVWFGIAAVYVMLFARIGLVEERTHLIEYGVVAVFVFEALSERFGSNPRRAAVLAVVVTSLIGWLDEGIQAILPNRVYDIRDVGFNAGAAVVAVLASLAIGWAERRARPDD